MSVKTDGVQLPSRKHNSHKGTTCFEVFEVAVPHPSEMPAESDYDCEVCCRPMAFVFTGDDVYAHGPEVNCRQSGNRFRPVNPYHCSRHQIHTGFSQ